MIKESIALAMLSTAAVALAKDYHVGADHPLKTISAAAELAQPGDIITVHAGVYRERVDPPRGGTSETNRITYQAAPGEKVVITGAEPRKGWEKVGGDTWKVVVPNSYFGDFNPFSHKIEGEWCEPTGRHAASVYLNGEWLEESLTLDPVLKPVGKSPLWFAEVGGTASQDSARLLAIKSFDVDGRSVPSLPYSSKKGEVGPVLEATFLGGALPGDWVAYEGIDLSKEQTIALKASMVEGSCEIEFIAGLGTAQAESLGRMTITKTGNARKLKTFSAPLRATSFPANKTLYMRFRSGAGRKISGNMTTIWAQFPGVNPNDADVEISKRQSVFYPSKTGINFITVRGFELCRAATPWAGAMSEQVGLIGTHWSKGWIIEDNDIHHSMCTGVSLGRYELPAAERPPESSPGFVKSMELALRDVWSKEKVGSHIVRNNRIHHCEKNAIHGSLGAAFSEISGNEIHDIALTRWVRGADTGGIKFLGGVDMVIRDNHIHRCGAFSGIWLDWSCQGALVEGNLLHDNNGHHGDLFLEMQHGPLLVANNLLLSRYSLAVNSEGLAIVQNLIAGKIDLFSDPRTTPFHPPHTVSIAGLVVACGGDHRFYNNLLKSPVDMSAEGLRRIFIEARGSAGPVLPSVEAGNAILPEGTTLTREPEGWSLSLTLDAADSSPRKIITSELLGAAVVSNCVFENRDGSPISIDTDYFGKPRDPANPGAGPFAGLKPGKNDLKVWPKKLSL